MTIRWKGVGNVLLIDVDLYSEELFSWEESMISRYDGEAECCISTKDC